MIRSLPKLFAAVSLIALASTGCATKGGKFACPSPDGVSCMSSVELYEATNFRDNLESSTGKHAGDGVATEGDSLALAPSPGSRVAFQDGSLALMGGASSRASDIPLRTEARIMRIWVSPWTDDSGDLVMPGHIFTEIEGRRWTLGGAAPSAATTLFDPNRVVIDDNPSFNPQN